MLKRLDRLRPDSLAKRVSNARRLADCGRHREAVMALEGSGEDLDSETQKDLVIWRNRAAAEAAASAPREDWPPALSDPFPELVDEIPEIAAKDLTPEILGGAILHHGSLIVRGLLDQAEIASLTEDLDRAFEGKLAWLADSTAPRTEWFALADRFDDPELESARVFQSPFALFMADSPRFLSRWISILRKTAILEVVASHLGEWPMLSAKKTTLYRLPPDPEGEWHQDGAFLGIDTRTVNLWVALSRCGDEAPGLQVVPRRLNQIVPPLEGDARFWWSVGPRGVANLMNGAPVADPVFEAGDAMLFDHLCLHSTSTRPGMTRPRQAIETWMFAPSCYPDSSPIYVPE